MKQAKDIKTKGQARDEAIKWQEWASKKSLSYGDLCSWCAYFTRLAKKFGLVREFKENGII